MGIGRWMRAWQFGQGPILNGSIQGWFAAIFRLCVQFSATYACKIIHANANLDFFHILVYVVRGVYESIRATRGPGGRFDWSGQGRHLLAAPGPGALQYYAGVPFRRFPTTWAMEYLFPHRQPHTPIHACQVGDDLLLWPGSQGWTGGWGQTEPPGRKVGGCPSSYAHM